MDKKGEKKIPRLHKRLFWEFRVDAIDWQKEYAVIIQRVIERGTTQEWKELVRFYGKDRVVKTLKEEVNYLPDEIIENVCSYFRLKPSHLKCYIRKQSLPRHLI